MSDLPEKGWAGYGAPGHQYDDARRKQLTTRVLRMFGQEKPSKADVLADMTFGHASRELSFSEWLLRKREIPDAVLEMLANVAGRKDSLP